MLLSINGSIIRIHATSISIMGRDARGVIAMRLDEGDKVASMAKIYSEDEDEKE